MGVEGLIKGVRFLLRVPGAKGSGFEGEKMGGW